MTAVNPEAPGSPTGPRLVVKAQKAEVAERMGKQIQTDPSPALKYEPSFKTLETSGEIGAQRVVTNGHHASKAFKNVNFQRERRSPQPEFSSKKISWIWSWTR